MHTRRRNTACTLQDAASLIDGDAHHLDIFPWLIILVHLDTFDIVNDVQPTDSSAKDTAMSDLKTQKHCIGL